MLKLRGYTDSIRQGIYWDYLAFRKKGMSRREALNAAEDLWFDAI